MYITSIPTSNVHRRPTAPFAALSVRRPLVRRVSAFTLIEILVVVAVIIILAGITVVVGGAVKQNSAKKSTMATLTTLKQLMIEYNDGGNPAVAIGDTTTYLKALRATKDAARLEHLKIVSGEVIDGWGHAIRWVPYDTATKKEGYFLSQGADTSRSDDDILSSDAL